jgi:hypothetical protein
MRPSNGFTISTSMDWFLYDIDDESSRNPDERPFPFSHHVRSRPSTGPIKLHQWQDARDRLPGGREASARGPAHMD